ncbi:hypothetical protein B0H17DRAFT_1154718 [Mycena rosella]|uniref:Uncharacterized protein n=1 Tax=Mycena rosella TaxID=1033263 RepID=A0AAD7AXV1_MYCRO|nr:hypothetical protein B0H17DRAFT_1154718 [Mycena rosella]
MEAVAGVIIGLLLSLSLGGLFIWQRRRRQRKAARTLIHSPFTLVPDGAAAEKVPLPDVPNTDARSISTMRREFLQNELRAAKEQILNIEDSEVGSTVATPGSVSGRILRKFTRSTTLTEVGSSEVSQLKPTYASDNIPKHRISREGNANLDVKRCSESDGSTSIVHSPNPSPSYLRRNLLEETRALTTDPWSAQPMYCPGSIAVDLWAIDMRGSGGIDKLSNSVMEYTLRFYDPRDRSQPEIISYLDGAQISPEWGEIWPPNAASTARCSLRVDMKSSHVGKLAKIHEEPVEII